MRATIRPIAAAVKTCVLPAKMPHPDRRRSLECQRSIWPERPIDGRETVKKRGERPGLACRDCCASAPPPRPPLMLLAPAIWNGFPLLQYDTGGYLARWFEGTLVVSRSTVYGLFLVRSALPGFLAGGDRAGGAHGLGAGADAARPRLRRAAAGAARRSRRCLSVATTLPWLASILLTDIFAGLAVLALYLLVLRDDALRALGARRRSIAARSRLRPRPTARRFAVLLALLARGAARARLIAAPACRSPASPRGVAALALGAVDAARRRISPPPAGSPGRRAASRCSFGRMLQDGIVARYLAEHCPDPRLPSCARIAPNCRPTPTCSSGARACSTGSAASTAWATEMRTDRARKPARLSAAAGSRRRCAATARQLVQVGTGEGVVNSDLAHLRHHRAHVAAVGAPTCARRASSAASSTSPPSTACIVPVALGSHAAARCRCSCSARRGRRFADLGRLAATVGARAPGQCRRLRRAGQPARPLRRAAGLDGRTAGACARPPAVRRQR